MHITPQRAIQHLGRLKRVAAAHPGCLKRESPFPSRSDGTARARRLFRHVGGAIALLWVTLGLLLPPAARAEAKFGDYIFTHWTRENGLPDNLVTCLLQTQNRFLWVGTGKGLVRFDGVKFMPVTIPAGNNSAAADITALFEDEKSNLWVGTKDGLWILDTEGMHQVELDPSYRNAAATCIAGDGRGKLWIGMTNGLIQLDGSTVTAFTAKQGLPSETISSVHVSGTNAVWITTRKGMCQLKDGLLSPLAFQSDSAGRNPEMIGMYNDQHGNLWAFGDTYLVNLNDGKRFNYFRSGDTTSLRIWSSCEGRNGQLWIGTSGQGVFSFSEGHFRPLSLREASLGSDVQAIHEDIDGNLWLGTFNSGLVRLQPQRVIPVSRDAGLPAEAADSLAVAADGRVWVGYALEGLFNKQSEHFEHVPISDKQETLSLVTSLAVGQNDEVWAGTLGLGLLRIKAGTVRRFTTEDGLADDEILAVAAQPDGTIWAGTSSGHVHRFTRGRPATFGGESGLAVSPVISILVSRSGLVYVGMENGHVSQFSNDHFTALALPASFQGCAIQAICEDADKRIWIGAQGKGLACVNNGTITVWDDKTGFPDNEVRSVTTDDFGRLWINTRRGIHVMSVAQSDSTSAKLPAIQTVLSYDNLLLSGAKHGWPKIAKAPDGRLWFAGPEAVYVLDPRDFQAPIAAYEATVDSVLANGRPLPVNHIFARNPGLDAKASLQLPSNLRTLDIGITAPSLISPERIQFQHRLDDFDKDWLESSPDRHVRYNGLPSGSYQFHVRAKNLDGTWAENDSTFAFTVPTPFYRLPWVIAVELAVAILAVVGVARVFFHRHLRQKLARISQREAMERERMRISRDMHDEIGSRLTRISYFSEVALQAESPSRESINSIAHAIRELLKTLDEIVWAVNPENDTLENFVAYLGHYVTEYLQNTSVECRLNMPHSVPAIPLMAETRHSVFLAFEEAISNALRHSGARRVSVDLTYDHETIEIRIQDDGKGFNLHPALPDGADKTGQNFRRRTGNGLNNIRLRLASVGGEAQIQSQPGTGTTVTFILTLKNLKKDNW